MGCIDAAPRWSFHQVVQHLEGIAEAAYEEAKVDNDDGDVELVVERLLGPGAIRRGPRPLHGPAALIRVQGRWRIILGRNVPMPAALFYVGHELGHWLLRRHGVQVDDEEAAADFLAGALLAPRRAFVGAVREHGHNLRALADAFDVTETAAALRLGEVLHVPLAVVAPTRVRVRGPEAWIWPPEPTLRGWARRPVPGLRRTRLVDDPRRVVLEADETA